MAIKKGVSAKTHTQKQLDDYANQHNPNNKAYQARIANEKKTKKSTRKQEAKRQAALFDELGLNADIDKSEPSSAARRMGKRVASSNRPPAGLEP